MHGNWASSMFDRELELYLAQNMCRQNCAGTFKVDDFVKMFAMLFTYLYHRHSVTGSR